jgi:hypothetical protein
VGPGEERSIAVEEARAGPRERKRGVRGADAAPTISIQVEGEFTPVKNLPMDKVVSYITRISPVHQNAFLAYEVAYRTGSRVLSVKSHMHIQNATNRPLEVIAVIEYQDTLLLAPIPPHSTVLLRCSLATSLTSPTPHSPGHR